MFAQISNKKPKFDHTVWLHDFLENLQCMYDKLVLTLSVLIVFNNIIEKVLL